MVSQVEDDLIDQTLEIKPTKKGSNQVSSALWKWLDTRKLHIIAKQKNLWHMIKLNYNFWTWIAKFGLDLNLLQEAAGPER